MRVRHAAEVARTEGAVVLIGVGVELVVLIGRVLAGGFGFPTVAAVEDVFDALVCWEFVRLATP